MDVFISWSGATAQKISAELKRHLELIVPGVRCFQSSEGIGKGERWANLVAEKLEGSNRGILCLTAENISAPWVNFEAGALSKQIDESRVIPVLFGADFSDLAGGPLAQFQAVQFRQEDMQLLAAQMASEVSPEAKANVLRYFEKFWPEFQTEIDRVLSEGALTPKVKPSQETQMLQQLVTQQTQLKRFLEAKLKDIQEPNDLISRMREHIEDTDQLIDEVSSFSIHAGGDLNMVSDALDGIEELVNSHVAFEVKELLK